MPLMDVPLGSPTRPSWRGRLHLIALCCSLPLLVLLAIDARGARERAGVIVFAVGLCSMFLVSTTYHRWVHTLRARKLWQRADHATIFAAIAGTFSVFVMACLGTGWAVVLMITIWSAAVLGALITVLGLKRARVIGLTLYLVLGWAGLLLVPAIWRTGGPLVVALVFAGGVCYTIGAICFGLRKPTLRPAVFGYHEVWHAFTIAAASLHLTAAWIVAA
jgi:hemolysin III